MIWVSSVAGTSARRSRTLSGWARFRLIWCGANMLIPVRSLSLTCRTDSKKSWSNWRLSGPAWHFLVGAGVLGKIYCDRIKARGGVALDVGSILDSWAMIPSRDPFKTTTPAFTLEHFKTVGPGWEEMAAALHKCKGELHAQDTTTTY